MKRTGLKRGKGFTSTSKPLKRGNALKSQQIALKPSKKKKVRDEEKRKAYSSVDSTREHRCEGCGSWDRPLSHSHLVSVARNISLEAEERNIRLHCISFLGVKGCHEKWEDGLLGEVDLMHDFIENMAIVKELDMEYFRIKSQKLYGE